MPLTDQASDCISLCRNYDSDERRSLPPNSQRAEGDNDEASLGSKAITAYVTASTKRQTPVFSMSWTNLLRNLANRRDGVSAN